MIDSKVGLCVFGYGSLLWRPGFEYDQSHKLTVFGWERRLWQGSPDHRGTMQQPGRVVTLVNRQEAQTTGLLYYVKPSKVSEVIRYLDERESGGYSRLWLPMMAPDGSRKKILTYTALAGNPNFLGPAPYNLMMDQIGTAVGASGKNIEYCRELYEALERLEVDDNEMNDLPDISKILL